MGPQLTEPSQRLKVEVKQADLMQILKDNNNKKFLFGSLAT